LFNIVNLDTTASNAASKISCSPPRAHNVAVSQIAKEQHQFFYL